MNLDQEELLHAISGLIARSMSAVKSDVEKMGFVTKGDMDVLTMRLDAVSEIRAKDGKDGKDADHEAISKQIQELFAQVKHGVDGENGKDGKDGIDGKSVTVEEVTPIIESLVSKVKAPSIDDLIPQVKELVKGEVEAIKATIQIPKDGANGSDGRDGIDGKSVTVDDVRPIIESLVGDVAKSIKAPKDGEAGRDGKDGEDGREGPPGRDAAHIDIHDSIDPQKRYGRNTYVHHNGGLVRSFRQTDPFNGDLEKSGWHVVVNGVSDLSFDFDGERTIKVVQSMTDGKALEKSVKVPLMIHRNVWRDQAYERGDVVTLGGSEWHAQKDTEAKPGTSEDWLLVVKRGRDGRDK